MNLTDLPNIGKEMARQLGEIGVTTPEALREMGAKEAWLKIKGIDPSACYNRLCGLYGAIEGVRWHHLPDETKQALKAFYNDHK